MRVCIAIVVVAVATVSGLYSPSDDVIELTPANFNSEVIQSDDIWLVEFYAPWCGHCKSLAPEWKKAATALKGVVKVGAVDMDQHQSLGQPYNVRGFPTLKVFGMNKQSPDDYQGARSASGIVEAALTHVRNLVNARLSGRKTGGGGGGGGSRGGGKKPGDPADVVELTDANFKELVLGGTDLWLVEFYAPWCGHCKTLAPHWASAASELKGKVKLGALDATVHTVTAGRYGVQGFPTIKMFSQGKKDGEASEYDGGRTASDIIAWATEKLAENIPPPEVVQVTADDTLKTACEDKQLCVISFLPHILDCQSKCRNDYLGVLRQLAEKYKKRMWGWVWAEAGAQPALEEAFGIGGFGYPAMAAANTRKMKYSWLRGSFGEEGINEFLRELAVGRGSTAPIKNAKLPDLIETEPWDGKDGEMPVEEEVDLSDVTLDDLDDVKKEEL